MWFQSGTWTEWLWTFQSWKGSISLFFQYRKFGRISIIFYQIGMFLNSRHKKWIEKIRGILSQICRYLKKDFHIVCHRNLIFLLKSVWIQLRISNLGRLDQINKITHARISTLPHICYGRWRTRSFFWSLVILRIWRCCRWFLCIFVDPPCNFWIAYKGV